MENRIREQAEKLNQTKPGQEPGGYCGVCGVPEQYCTCKSYKETGADHKYEGERAPDYKPYKG
jgi:hypothetical protein